MYMCVKILIWPFSTTIMQIEVKSICANKQAQFYSQHLNNIFPRGSTDTDSPSMELFQQHLRLFPHVVFTIGCEEFLEANDGKNGGFCLYLLSVCRAVTVLRAPDVAYYSRQSLLSTFQARLPLKCTAI